MRVFLSLGFDSKIRPALSDLSRTLPYFDQSIFSLVPKENYHLTLKFFGDVKTSDVDKIISTLDPIRIQKFTFDLFGVGVFPSLSNPRVIWVGVRKNPDFSNLLGAIDASFSVFSDKKQTSFVPHVTLARLKKKFSLDKWISSHSNFTCPSTSAISLDLVETIISDESVSYKLLKSIDFI